MKKIYSFMLMATMLLIGINANAADQSVSSRDDLQAAFNQAVDGDVITISAGFSISSTVKIVLPQATKVTLDLAGNTLSSTGSGAAVDMFHLYRGKLTVKNGVIRHAGSTSGSPLIFKVFGTGEKVAAGNYTHLTINEDVQLFVSGGDYKGYGISINERGAITDPTSLPTTIVNDAVALANGIRLDVHGYVEMMSAKGYCVKVNGSIKYAPARWNDLGVTNPTAADTTEWVACAPHVYLHSTAHLVANASSTGVGAIYAAGYGVWDIRCEAEGSCALAAKSGEINVVDAVLKSTATEYHIPAGLSAGVETQGTAVLIESNSSYPGYTQVNFSGDTRVEAVSGYAIEEAITTASQTKVSAIDIEGGAFIGGNEAGCIYIDDRTLSAEGTQVTIGGGAYEDRTPQQQAATDALITQIITGSNTYTTQVATGNTTTTGSAIVITSGTTPGVQPSSLDIDDLYHISSEKSDSSVNLSQVTDGTVFTLDDATGHGNLTLGDVVMNGNNLTIIVKNGITFTAKQLIMNNKAKIIVEAGGKLIVYGKQGIIAPVHDNIELKANSEAQALFVVSPEVTSNRQPKATVQLYTIGKNAPSHPVWQRGTTPMAVFNSFSHDGQTVSGMGSAYRNWIMYYDEAAAQWTNINAYSEMKPFTAYAMTNNSPQGGVTYTFTGNLQGNVSDNIKLNTVGWNYMANSFMAPMQVKALIDTIMDQAGDNLDGTIYLYKGLQYVTINATTLDLFGSPQDSIAALSSFIVKTNNEPMTLDVNYRKSIFNYVVGGMQPAQAAPARRSTSNNNTTTICLQLTADNGEQDKVYFIEGNDYTAEYENGADAEKFMNENLNIYAAGDMNQSIVASDDINGTMLSFNTTDAYNYTISFSHVRGTEKALRDNQTGRIVAIENGTTYSFVAQANEAIEGRFEIIEAAKMPTDVEMLEAAPAKKGIFSLQGQYLGEDLRVLPAGIYVVNGQKIVK